MREACQVLFYWEAGEGFLVAHWTLSPKLCVLCTLRKRRGWKWRWHCQGQNTSYLGDSLTASYPELLVATLSVFQNFEIRDTDLEGDLLRPAQQRQKHTLTILQQGRGDIRGHSSSLVTLRNWTFVRQMRQKQTQSIRDLGQQCRHVRTWRQ